MDIVLEHVQIWEPPCTFFAGTCYWRDHDVMGEKFLLTKLIKFGDCRKGISCWSIFPIKPIAYFCRFLGYWPSKNTSRDHGIQGDFVSFAKPIILCTIEKKILCWSTFSIESIVDIYPFWSYWSSKNWPRDHDEKGDFISLVKYIVFGTTGKSVLCWSIIAREPIAEFSLFLG